MSTRPLRSSALGGLVPLPPDFPTLAFDAVARRISDYTDAAASAPRNVRRRAERRHRDFAFSWNAVGYRTVAAWRAADSFKRIVGSDDRLAMELALFAFFTNALSALECAYYGMSVAGAIVEPPTSVKPLHFRLLNPVARRKRINPGSVSDTYRTAAFRRGRMVRVLDSVRRSRDYRRIEDFRNVLAHRASPGHKINLSSAKSVASVAAGGLPEDDEWLIRRGVKLEANMLLRHYEALMKLLTKLVEAAARFLKAQPGPVPGVRARGSRLRRKP